VFVFICLTYLCFVNWQFLRCQITIFVMFVGCVGGLRDAFCLWLSVHFCACVLVFVFLCLIYMFLNFYFFRFVNWPFSPCQLAICYALGGLCVAVCVTLSVCNGFREFYVFMCVCVCACVVVSLCLCCCQFVLMFLALELVSSQRLKPRVLLLLCVFCDGLWWWTSWGSNSYLWRVGGDDEGQLCDECYRV